ncbi:TnpV protein [Anaerovorax odorimutans]|uniref:TnpV protein n=2 Tax=Anaerovorax odorimutans TaxID=109327 RepID=A0ABT1RU20_9FIRM|nr:TnpV protein [Anaerovorax odorimutans]MCQ4638665.1 TnpV protein [Anaerovorax odorimutans]
MMKLTYSKQGDYLLPDLIAHKEPEASPGKYAYLRREYLKEQHYGMFLSLLTQGTLNQHLTEIQEAAQARMTQITREMARNQQVNEQLKADNPMLWVGQMNNIRQAAEEIVMQELIYR